MRRAYLFFIKLFSARLFVPSLVFAAVLGAHFYPHPQSSLDFDGFESGEQSPKKPPTDDIVLEALGAPHRFEKIFTGITKSNFVITRDSERKNAQDYCIRKMIDLYGPDLKVWAIRTASRSSDSRFDVHCDAVYFRNTAEQKKSILYYIDTHLSFAPLQSKDLGRVISKVSRSTEEPFFSLTIENMEPGAPLPNSLAKIQTAVQEYSELTWKTQDTPDAAGSRSLAAENSQDTLKKAELGLLLPVISGEKEGHFWIPKLHPGGRNSALSLELDGHATDLYLVSDRLQFPPGFKWGVATSSHQVEGGDVKSDWFEFEKKDGTIFKGDRSLNGPDHWNHLEEDTLLMARLGVTQYRFSFEWAKIEPQEGVWDWDVIAHYRKEMALLKKYKIEPIITLHHFTLPNWLRQKGGWEWEGSPEAFARYSVFVMENIGPDVRDWVTFNEPLLHMLGGYIKGVNPPGLKGGLNTLKVPLTNYLKAHALTYHRLKESALRNHHEIRVGVAHRLELFVPYRPSNILDQQVTQVALQNYNWVIPNAIETGVLTLKASVFGGFEVQIPELIGTQDFFGVNYYTRFALEYRFPLDIHQSAPEGVTDVTELGWEIHPEGMYEILKAVHSRYTRLPIVILENGVADGWDRYRAKYIHDHLVYLHYAIEKGIPVENYIYWSLYDNFEWDQGFSVRVGLCAVDFESKKRTPRESAKYFSSIAHGNGVPLDF